MQKSDLVAVLLVVFIGIVTWQSGVVGRVGQAIDGKLTVGGQ